MMMKKFKKEVFTSGDAGIFTTTYGRYDSKKKNALYHLKRFLNNNTPTLKFSSKNLFNLVKLLKEKESKEQKEKKKQIQEKEKNEYSVDEATPFTGHASLANPILNSKD